MPEASDFPTRNTIAGQHWRQHQVHDVGFRGTEAAWSRYYGNIVFVGQQEEITRLHWGQETLDVAAGSNQGTTDNIVGTCRGGGGRDQDRSWFRTQQML